MSAVVYAEPYKLPAGVLTLAVHGALFALLYFGMSWQTQPPQGMVVDIWESLSEAGGVPVRDEAPQVEKVEPPKPVEPSKPVKPAQLEAPPKADIELAEKKKQKKLEAQAELKAQAEREARAEREAQAEQGRVRAEQAAAMGKIINEYVGKIRAKIKRNIVEPRDLPASIHGKFSITVLPGGSVLDVRLVRSSGNAAYDSAVERAILKSQPLPVPEDVTLFQKFREISFPFCPDKGGGKCEE